MKVDLILTNCSELHTLKGPKRARIKEEMKDTGMISDGAIAIDKGHVEQTGKTQEILGNFEADEVHDVSNKTVIPGFIDPHTHLVYAGSREDELVMKIEGKTYMDILEEGGGILRTVRNTRKASKQELKASSKKRLNTMLQYGTTTAEAKSGYGLDIKNEIKSLEVIKELDEEHPIDIVPTYLGAHSLPPEFEGSEDYIDFCIEKVLPEIVNNNLAEFIDVFCEEGVFNSDESRELLSEAKAAGMGVKVHADEIENIGCSKMAAELNALSCEHLVQTSDTDMEMMAKAGTIGILLPGTPFMLMEDEYSPVRKMINKGMALALATDLNPNCWTESMQMIITLACLEMKMTPREALTASTVNAARAIGRKDIGTLSKGKKADIVVLDIPNIDHLPYHFGVNLVDKVFKEGEKVIDNSEEGASSGR